MKLKFIICSQPSEIEGSPVRVKRDNNLHKIPNHSSTAIGFHEI